MKLSTTAFLRRREALEAAWTMMLVDTDAMTSAFVSGAPPTREKYRKF